MYNATHKVLLRISTITSLDPRLVPSNREKKREKKKKEKDWFSSSNQQRHNVQIVTCHH